MLNGVGSARFVVDGSSDVVTVEVDRLEWKGLRAEGGAWLCFLVLVRGKMERGRAEVEAKERERRGAKAKGRKEAKGGRERDRGGDS